MKRRDPGVSEDGKVYRGAVIRDPQTGREYDVLQVLRPEDLELDTPIGAYRGSSAGLCALHGGKAQWR